MIKKLLNRKSRKLKAQDENRKGKFPCKILCITLFTAFLFPFSIKTKAQVTVFAGGSYCQVSDNNILENKKPIAGYQIGSSYNFYPLKKHQNISILIELMFSQKGYQQNLGKNYIRQFNYISIPAMLNYDVNDFFSIQAGAELSRLCKVNVKYWAETYKRHDIGLTFGITCFRNKRINIYTRAYFGLVPMLDYFDIDQSGNFTGEIHGLKNMCITTGIKLNLDNEKIYLFK